MEEQYVAMPGSIPRCSLGRALDVTIHEVINDLNMVMNIEFLQRALFQVLRDGGHAVTLLDGITGHRQMNGPRRRW